MSDINTFIRQIRSRSAEHERSVKALLSVEAHGQIVSILRQELDSMVRVIYLLSLPVDRRLALVSASVEGERLRRENSGGVLTDQEMVQLAQKLQGWTQSVYKFGCAFIHLSALHDYEHRDPIARLSDNERRDLIAYCRLYHGGPTQDAPTFREFVPYLPAVFTKISNNLGCYLNDLAADKPPSVL